MRELGSLCLICLCGVVTLDTLQVGVPNLFKPVYEGDQFSTSASCYSYFSGSYSLIGEAVRLCRTSGSCAECTPCLACTRCNPAGPSGGECAPPEEGGRGEGIRVVEGREGGR